MPIYFSTGSRYKAIKYSFWSGMTEPLGAFLSFLGLYEVMLDWAGAGASVPITNFGHLLFKGAYEGFLSDGFTGLLKGILSTSSGGLSVTIIMAFLVAIFSKPKH